ncbi:uncharacterized protein LOC143053813 isoform X1 [Mytilus galloprovincialis]|uniref:uncharacterized protein LOC143053813 isoform X1 n=1 Tax=Mytilus galloprovincialis TaxID=29158 RepID=UPI003F7B65BB
MLTFTLLFGLIAGALCIPPPTREEDALMNLLSPEQFSKFTAESKHPLPAHSTRTSFKHKYVYCNGGIADYKSGTTIDITATTSVSGTAHTKAAQIIARMVKYMPSAICNSVAGQVKIGVFTKSEGMMIYPYNHYVADRAECRGICSGACKNTCTPDGRKYGTLAGSGGRTTTILDDNILCNAADPYLHTFNVLVHEFTHSVHTYGVDAAMKTRITNSYNAARAHRTWEMSSYSMSSEGEYLAQGASAYFNTNRGISHGNYMNECSNSVLCANEAAMRYHLWAKDKELYSILSYIYTSNHAEKPSGLHVCV